MIVSRVHPQRGVQYVRRIVFRSRYKNHCPLVLWHADRALALDMASEEAVSKPALAKPKPPKPSSNGHNLTQKMTRELALDEFDEADE